MTTNDYESWLETPLTNLVLNEIKEEINKNEQLLITGGVLPEDYTGMINYLNGLKFIFNLSRDEDDL